MRGGPAPSPGGGGGAGAGPSPFEGGGMPGGFGFGGMPGGGGGRTFHFSTGPGGGGGFRFSNADDIFRDFAKASGGMGMEDDDLFSMLGGGLGGGFGGGGRGFRSRGGPTSRAQQPRRAPTPEPTVVEKDLPLTLEELFSGTIKKVTTKSKAFDPSGKRTVQEVTLEANVKPGLRTGSKIKYRGVGDQEEGGKQDVHLIVTEVSRECNACPSEYSLILLQKEHPLYKRQGDNLIVQVNISLKEALTGWESIVRTIDGKSIRVSKPGPTQPGHEERYPGLGMTISKKPNERGDLIVRVNVKFPTELSSQQKQQLKEVLP